MSEFPSIIILVPVYQGERTITQCLNALIAQEYQGAMEIVCVDDGSTDSTISLISGYRGVRLIRSSHKGRAAALNLGLAEACSEIVLFTDADCSPDPDWASGLVSILLADQDLAGVGGNQLPEILSGVEVGKVLPYLHEFSEDIPLQGSYRGVCLNGNNMALRKQALEDVNGFDETYLHGADADLTRRLLENGHRLLRISGSVVKHLKQDSLKSHVKTRFQRGSTVRFAMEQGEFTSFSLVRSFAKLFLELLRDFIRLQDLNVLERPMSLWSRITAPFLNFLAGFVNWSGQAYYYFHFR